MKTKIFILAILLATTTLSYGLTKKNPDKITGKIYELVDGEKIPLPMAFVFINSSENFSHSDFDGNFSINLPKNAKELNVSFKGYNQETFSIDKKTNELIIVLSKESNLVTEK